MILRKKPISIGLLLGCMPVIGSADWTNQPFARSALALDDNIRFVSKDKESSAVLNLEAGVVLGNKTEVLTTRFVPRIAYRAYGQDSGLNSLDQYLDFSTASLGERSDLGLKLAFSNTSTLTSELEDSGNTFVNKRRSLFSMNPSWRYLLTQLLSMKVSYRFDGSHYEDSGKNGLNDYENQVADIDMERRLTEDSDFVTRAYYKRYKAITLTNKANTIGLELGYIKRFTPTIDGSFFLGGFSTKSTIQGDDTSKQGVSAKIQGKYKREAEQYSVNYTSGVVPSSTGEVYTENSLRFSANIQHDEKLSWGVNALVQLRDTINTTTTQSARTYYYIIPFIGWRLSRDWTISSSYTYSGENRDNADSVDRNQFNVSAEYRLPENTVY